jgi:hypothetical protein
MLHSNPVSDMKRPFLLLIGVVSTFTTPAFAELPTLGGLPRLEFRSIPVEDAPTSEHKVTPYRLFDKMIVTVWDPVACGQKPISPSFSIEGNRLLLSYKLSPAPAEAKRCTLVSEFDVFNVPKRDLQAYFAGGPEPYTVATLRKCPYHNATSNDIWECLIPTKQ